MDLNGPPVKLFCPNDLQFNPIMQKCDDPSKVATVKPECVKSFTSTNNVVSKLSKVNSKILYTCMNTVIIKICPIQGKTLHIDIFIIGT